MFPSNAGNRRAAGRRRRHLRRYRLRRQDERVHRANRQSFFGGEYDKSTFDWAKAYEKVLADGADIVSGSYSVVNDPVDDNWTTETFRTFLSDVSPAWSGRITAIAQAHRDPVDRTIFVWSAGNDGNSSPNARTGGAVGLLKELQGHNVVVVAVDEDGKIWGTSNRCGTKATAWCIAAPGVDIAVAYFGPNPDPGPDPVRFVKRGNGTSYAAPMVAGGLALIKQFFRDQLSNPELLVRLFATADKSGDYANTAIYGQGLMDLGAAVTPVGWERVTTGSHVLDRGHDVRATGLNLGSALGDGLSRSLAGREIAAFDALGAPFWFDLSGLVEPAGRPALDSRLRALLDPANVGDSLAGGTRFSLAPHGNAVERDGWRFGLWESPVQSESSLLNLAGNAATFTFQAPDGLEVMVFTSRGLAEEETPEHGAVLAWRPSDEPFGLRLGWLGEEKAVVGSTGEGAFGRLSAGSVAAGFEFGTELAGWRLAADAEVGLVAADTDGGIMTGLSDVATSAVSFRAGRRLENDDEITLSLSQPVRVEHGEVLLEVPVGRTRDRAVVHESISAELSPSGRQFDLAARWQRPGVFGGELRAEAVVSHDPGHVDGTSEFGLLVGWRVEF